MKCGRRSISLAVAALALGVAACGGHSQFVPVPNQASIPQFNLLAPDAGGKITLKPARLAFKNVGIKFAKTVTVTDLGYTGKISESLTACKRFAKAVPAFGKGPTYKVKITPLRSGRCSIVFSDTKKHKATLPITVSTPAPGVVVANPASVTICPASGVAMCASDSQAVSLTQSGYTGAFSALNSCGSTVATVTGSGHSYTVSGASATGTCTATFVGGAGKFATVPITVVGSVVAAPSSVAICPSTGTDSCTADNATVALTQVNYSGTFTETDDCPAATATVTQLNKSTYRVTGGSQINHCTATFTGILGQNLKLSIATVNGVVINLKKERMK